MAAELPGDRLPGVLGEAQIVDELGDKRGINERIQQHFYGEWLKRETELAERPDALTFSPEKNLLMERMAEKNRRHAPVDTTPEEPPEPEQP